MSDDTAAKDFRDLIDWVVSNGGYIHPNLRFSHASTAGDASGSSLITTTDIDPDTELLRCPHVCNISVEKARAGFSEKFSDAVPPHALLCFFVAKQKLLGKESFWEPYIRVLPKTFDTLLYFSDEDFQFLQGCNLSRQHAEERREEWQAEWKTALKALEAAGEDPAPYTWDLILWSATVLTTRSFLGSLLRPTTSSPKPTDSHPVLFPLVDSLNHRPLTPITWSPSTTCLSLFPNTPISASSELYNNYGPKPNAELLMGYGFSLASNPCDHYPLVINPPLSPSQRKIRTLQLQSLSLPPSDNGQYSITISTSPIIPPSLITLFRLLTATPNELPLLQITPTSPISLRNELSTHSQLLMALRMKLPAITNPLPHPPKNSRQKFATIYRESQAMILKSALTETKTRLHDIYSTGTSSGALISLTTALSDPTFSAAIEACFGTAGESELEEEDQEDIVFVLYICWKYLHRSEPGNEKWAQWVERIIRDRVYGTPDDEPEEGVDEIFEAIFPAAGEAAPEVFADPEGGRWCVELVAWALRVFQGEGINAVGVGEADADVYVIELRS
ncbi:SET domain-containing protein [Ascodesmis nigricans]|uniref:SET domain-containing protein n=1 Tax=Ascodesmis nigricans TaxID=341454 RepID=A0A4V3SI47_9PEZI|nr:SET domain-containing protein [Ascodesmis nigricans]